MVVCPFHPVVGVQGVEAWESRQSLNLGKKNSTGTSSCECHMLAKNTACHIFAHWDHGVVLTWSPLSIEKRLKKLDREADNYKNTDQADLAEGLKVQTKFNPLVRTNMPEFLSMSTSQEPTRVLGLSHSMDLLACARIAGPPSL
jgi:hypothetical protein